jgi:outer membrane protein TolC
MHELGGLARTQIVNLAILALLLCPAARAAMEDLRPPAPGANLQAPAAAQAPVKLTLDQALDEAYLANPTLKLMESQRPVAEAGVTQAKIRVNPFYQGEFAPAETTYRFFVITTTTQLGLKRQRRVEVAKRLIDSTNATIRTMAWKIRQDTESAYFEFAVARQTLEVMEDYLATAKRLSAITQKRREARDASGLEVLRAEAAVADAQAQLVPVQVRVEQAIRQLNLILGRQPENPIDIAPPSFLSLGKLSARIPPFATLITEAEKSRPEFRQNAADLAVQASRIKLAKSLWWPDVQTSMGMSSVPQLNAQEAHNWFGSHLLNKPAWILTMPLSINDHGQGILATAKATYRQLQQQRIALVNQVRQEVNLTYSSAYATERQMDILFNESLPRQAKILSMSETGYKSGVLDLTAAITAQQAALAARINFLQTATSYFQALVQLERAVGRPIISEMVQGGKQPQP